jgi:phosphatidylserine/phosphatidylglycerophosphate/cardiolipin synthase-like enzyme
MPDVPLVDDVSLAAAQPQVHPPQKFTGRFTIQPLLTPDNYLEHLTKLVQGAQNSLRIQNQYIKLPARGGDEFIGFLELLRDKAKQFKTNFRVIVRNLPGVQEQLEALEHFGFDMNQFKRQTNTHTKGVIVDDQTVLVGSHNWSNQGVLENRDASLIVYDRKVAQFYATLFDHDWQVLAHQTGAAGAATMPATSLNWSEYLS